MRHFGLLSTLLLTALAASGGDSPNWLRYPAISPDGTTIAFTYKGDIYTVPSSGGTATRLTTDDSMDYNPVWSPDSKTIAFASNRHGNFDVYTIPAKGGTPTRLTTHSSSEIPNCFSRDGQHILFDATIADPAESILNPSASMKELYSVPVFGGRPLQILATPAEHAQFSHSGKFIIYQDKKGGENIWRKHHRSSITRDIWKYDIASRMHQKLTDFSGEDRSPVMSADDKTVYYLSEQDGSFNVWSFPIDNPSARQQITQFKTHPVRFLSLADTGMLCFGYNGAIYTQVPGTAPSVVNIQVSGDITSNDQLIQSVFPRGGQPSRDGKQIAFVHRGDIFVTSTTYPTTKQITYTPEAEYSPNFSPDGRTLAYTSERNGQRNIYLAKLARKTDPNFPNALSLEEKPLVANAEHERESAQFSPDGKEIAFVEDRSRIMIMDLQTKEIRQVVDGSQTYSTGGFIDYSWSPDGQWLTLAYTGNKHDPYYDIGIVHTSGKQSIVNLTNSGYSNAKPRWILDGNALLFLTERYGMRNHASWGSLSDAMIVFLNKKSMEQFQMSKEERELAQAKDSPQTDKVDKDQKDSKTAKKASNDPPKAKPITVELEGLEDRFVRLTPASTQLADAALDQKGEKLYYICSFQKGFDLWQLDLATRTPRLLRSDISPASLQWDQAMSKLFILGDKPVYMDRKSNAISTITASAEHNIDKSQERVAMFQHVCHEEERRFYREDMHGVDWKKLTANYKQFLPSINNNYDFAELLSELLGELNVSHTGCSYSGDRSPSSDSTAELGLFFDQDYVGTGLKIDEIVTGGPFDRSEFDIQRGDIIEMINGVFIKADMDYYPLLNRQAGKKILVSLRRPETQQTFEVVVKPITRSALNSLLYKRWVKQCEREVDRLSKGRLGYVHIQGMNDPSFRTVYSIVLGKFNNREGIVIDTRFNGGGRLHEDIEVLFSGEKYLTQVIRGKEACDMPSRRWNKPSVMVIGEANYSNAHGTPWVYKHQKLGKLVGMPVPGTMTSVNWERLQDSSLIFGIPIIGYRLPDGTYLENTQLEPDVKVANTPDSVVYGHDKQLEAAVQTLLNDIDASPKAQ